MDARNAFDLAHLLDQLDANLAAFRTLVLGAFHPLDQLVRDDDAPQVLAHPPC